MLMFKIFSLWDQEVKISLKLPSSFMHRELRPFLRHRKSGRQLRFPLKIIIIEAK